MRIKIVKNSVRLVLIASLFIFLNGCWWASLLTGQKTFKLSPDLGSPHTPIYTQGDWIIARASLHNHTNISDGVYTPEDLITLAKREGIAILAITDHREGAIKLSGGIKIPVNGIEKIGYDEYFKKLTPLKQSAEADKKMIVLLGVEANPFLYNIGKFPYAVIMEQNSHFVVYQISDPQVFKNMPAWREVSLKPLNSPPGQKHVQDWVDYMAANSGLLFVAHPASEMSTWVLTIHFYSEPPYKNLRLKNITGFSSLPESFGPEIAAAGGAWDSVLAEYLDGMREKPIWADADCDFHGNFNDDLTTYCGTTLFYLKEFSEKDIYSSMQQGRMVALEGDAFQNSYVAEFSVSDKGAPENEVMMGSEIKISAPPIVRFRLDHDVPGVKTYLIRNGKVVKEVGGTSLEYKDQEMFDKKMPAYYRIEVAGPITPIVNPMDPYPKNNILFTNPVFVRF